jgi:hypothetical protein
VRAFGLILTSVLLGIASGCARNDGLEIPGTRAALVSKQAYSPAA